jgi:gas vesicle protein
MKYVAVSISSAILGALVALLFAPSSGNELRSNIKNVVDTQVTKAKDEWQKGMQDVVTRVEKLKSERKERNAELKEPSMDIETIV